MRVVVGLLLVSGLAYADDPRRCVDVQFTPVDNLQIVAWVETVDGTYVDTVYVTQQIGSFGLGNRPGRFDFNSGPGWPYGRRTTTFPVWSHRHGKTFPAVLFQNDVSEDVDYCLDSSIQDYAGCGENDLSHPYDQSSRENHFCRPRIEGEAGWDTGTCATPAFTDKGKFSSTSVALYPPRTDLTRAASDSPSVEMFKAMNPFDAVSQPTPIGGTNSHAPWPMPAGLAAGDYVMWIETAQENDFNATYNQGSYPSPMDVGWNGYGLAYRGQPSIVYRVPFTAGGTTTTSTTQSYAGYGDPDGLDGTVRAPDATITSDTPGSGAARLELVADADGMYRARVSVRTIDTADLPGVPTELQPIAVDTNSMTLSFVAPGIGTQATQVTGYDVRIRASDEITAANFEDSMPVTAHVLPSSAGSTQTFDLTGLLPQTDYWIGIRAYDGCHDNGDLAIVKVTTSQRVSGTVDACFVATAAYGSLLANDVELLRHFRDATLETNALGELGVEAYYTFGPTVAGVVGESDLLRSSARDALAPIIERVRKLRF
ncbi:MAG TPA: fibronectin type III domain-containing protein [Kofleriaceae bacterium]|nr:fibronectin type III domain-containing protein [Kofleriaceae bacterium]